MDFKLFNREFGYTDLILIDQILKGRFGSKGKILDAGCGEGRNLIYFFQNNYEVYGIDKNFSALRMLKIQGKMLSENFNPENFIQGDLILPPYKDDFFDFILCISVLHFVESETQFYMILDQLLRILKTDGILFLSMNAVYGMENQLIKSGHNHYQLPDHGVRFLFNDNLYTTLQQNRNLEMTEPLKTITIHSRESNAYLVLKKIS